MTRSATTRGPWNTQTTWTTTYTPCFVTTTTVVTSTLTPGQETITSVVTDIVTDVAETVTNTGTETLTTTDTVRLTLLHSETKNVVAVIDYRR
jgi:hypothetical protein